MIPQNCRRKNLGDNVMKNWHRVKNIENELDCDSTEVEVEILVGGGGGGGGCSATPNV